MFWKRKIQVDVQIDYDKLAAAIVKANKAEQEKPEASSEVLKLILAWSFYLLGGFLLVTAVYGGWKAATESVGIVSIVTYVLAYVVFFIYGLFAIMWGRSVNKIRNKQYLVGFFSAIVALTALIVTIVK